MKMPNLKLVLWFLLIVLLVLMLRWPTFSSRIWNGDEAIQATIANVILEGGLPYKDAVCQRAPVTWYFFALIFWFFGKNNMLAIHAALAILIIITTIIIYGIGRQVGNSRASLMATFFFVLTSSLGWSYKDTYAFHTEFCLIFFTCLGSYLFLRSLLINQSMRLAMMAGVSYGLAFFSKQPALFDFLATFLFLLYLSISKNSELKVKGLLNLTKIGILLSSGFALTTMGWFLFFYLGGAWKDFTFYFFTYNVEYYLPAIPVFHRLMLIPAALGETITSGLLIGLLALIGLAFVLLKLPKEESNGHKYAPQLFIATWAVLSFLGSASTGRLYGHYFIQVTPAWSLLGGIAIDIMMKEAFGPSSGSSSSLNRPGRLVIGVLMIALFIGPLVGAYFRLVPSVLGNLRKWSRMAAAAAPTDVEGFARFDPDSIIEYVKHNTPSNSKIFVWGFKPHYYVQTNRLPASRYIYCVQVVGLIPWEEAYSKPVPGSLDILVSDLRSTMPILIIDTSTNRCSGEVFQDYPLTNFPVLWKFINNNYKLDCYVNNCAVYKLDGAAGSKNMLKHGELNQ